MYLEYNRKIPIIIEIYLLRTDINYSILKRPQKADVLDEYPILGQNDYRITSSNSFFRKMISVFIFINSIDFYNSFTLRHYF